MTSFTRTWNATYLAQPPDSEDINLGATRIRQLKSDIKERMQVDHSFAGDADDGAHKKVTLLEQASDPTPVANTGYLYTKDADAGDTEFFYMDALGNVIQITDDGTLTPHRSVKNHGAVGNGVSADATPINDTIAAATEGQIIFLPVGTYACDASIINSNKAITILGESQTGTILKFTGVDGLTLTHDGSNLKSIEVMNLSITTTNNGTQTGVNFTAVSASALKVPRLRMERVSITGNSLAGTQEWLVGLSITEGDAAHLTDVTIKGKETAYISGYLPATKGMVVNNSSTVHASGVQIYRVKTGLEITGQSEGLVMQSSEIVAVHTGISGTSLAAPANNHQFNNVHIAASQTGIKFDQTTTATKTIGHTFSNMFILKRLGDGGMGAGGDANYKAMDLSVDRCVFTNISLHTGDATTDRYTDGDRGIYLRDGSQNNMITNLVGFNCGTCVSCIDTSRDNFLNHIVLVNTSAFTYKPFESDITDGQITSAIIDTSSAAPVPVDPNSAWRQIGSKFDFVTRGGLAFRVANGDNAADSYLDVFGLALADARAVLRANSESGAADVDLELRPKGAGRVWLGPHAASGDAAINGYILVKDNTGAVKKLATIA